MHAESNHRTLFRFIGSADIGPTDGAPLLHFVKRQDMVVWRPASLGD
jgi:hypothetical protein